MKQTWKWTPVRLRILAALVEADAPVWPLDLAARLGVSHGTVYGTLRMVYDLGWAVGITEEPMPGRPPRVSYRLTEQGRTEAPALLSREEN